MYSKHLNNNLHTVASQTVNLHAFLACPADFHLRPAPWIFIPAPLEKALPRTSGIHTAESSGVVKFSNKSVLYSLTIKTPNDDAFTCCCRQWEMTRSSCAWSWLNLKWSFEHCFAIYIVNVRFRFVYLYLLKFYLSYIVFPPLLQYEE